MPKPNGTALRIGTRWGAQPMSEARLRTRSESQIDNRSTVVLGTSNPDLLVVKVHPALAMGERAAGACPVRPIVRVGESDHVAGPEPARKIGHYQRMPTVGLFVITRPNHP